MSKKKVRVVLNRNGVANLMKSAEMQSVLNGLASQKATQCGDGFGSNVKVGQRRSYANIFAETYEAARKNEDTNILVKAVGV